MSITFIGDLHQVHGDIAYYRSIIKRHTNTVQLGDFGFGREWTQLGYTVDSKHHRVLGGNHDDYNVAPKTPNWLGDYGVCDTLGTPFFFIRGGHSIDCHDRIFKEVSCGVQEYWHNEELNFAEMLACARDYGHLCMDLVVSHDCPSFVNDEMHKNDPSPNVLERCGWPKNYRSNTSLLLTELWNSHAPKLWIFGHHHRSFRFKYGPTQFVGLGIGEIYCVEQQDSSKSDTLSN